MDKKGFYIKIFFFLFLFFLVGVATMFAYMSPGDFCQDYRSAQHFLSGEPVYSSISCDNLTYNAHPPFTIILFAPFVLFPLLYATLLWSILSLACYVISGLLLLEMLGWLSYRNSLLFIIISGCWPAFLVASAEHNISQLLLLLLVVSWWMQRKKRLYAAGILIGVASLLRPWLFVLVMGLLLSKQYKQAFSGVITIIVGLLFSFFLFGQSAYTEYIGPIRMYEDSWIVHPLNLSLTGAFAKVPLVAPYLNLSVGNAIAIGEFFSLIILLCILLFVWQYNKRNKYINGEHTQMLLLTVAWLTFPLSWGWSLILFLIPCSYIILILRQLPKQFIGWYFLLGFGLMFMLDPSALFLGKFNSGDYTTIRSYINIASYVAITETIGIFLFVVAQVILLFKVHPPIKKVFSSVD